MDFPPRDPATPEERERLRSLLRQRLSARPEIEFAYLHGSFAEGLPYHDIDVAVYLREDETFSRDEIFDYEMDLSVELTLALHTDVDIHVLNKAPLGFQHSVLQGELLFARDEERLCDYIEWVSAEVMAFSHHAEDYLREVLSWRT
jgi:predicted nucleotidyltransferase